jgi:hypothetical protein
MPTEQFRGTDLRPKNAPSARFEDSDTKVGPNQLDGRHSPPLFYVEDDGKGRNQRFGQKTSYLPRLQVFCHMRNHQTWQSPKP